MVLEQGSVAKGITYGGVGTTFLGWFTVTEWAAIIGVAATLFGLFLQYLAWQRKSLSSVISKSMRSECRSTALNLSA